MTIAELKTLFWDIFGGDDDIYPDVDDILVDAISDACRDLAAEGDSIVDHTTIDCVAGTQEYSLGVDNIDKVLRVSYDHERLNLIGKFTLQTARPDGWDRHQGKPRRYYLDGTNNKIGLFEIPSVDSDGGDYAIGIWYTRAPATVSLDGASPHAPRWAHPYLLFYALWRAYSMVSRSRDQELAGFWKSMYMAGKARVKARASAPTPKSYFMREDGTEALRGGWPAMYPRHIEEA
jgi:hypothetical protein